MQYKHLTEGMEVNKFNLSEIVDAMTLKHKPSKMSRGASYEEIAYVWLYVIPFKVLKYRMFPRKDNAIQLSLDEIRDAFLYRYKKDNKLHYWFNWFQDNYPLYIITQQGNSMTGKKSYGIPNIHIVDSLMKAEPKKFTEAFGDEFQAKAQDIGDNIDYIEIDVENLERYIKQTYKNWTADGARNEKLKRYIIDALAIQKLAIGFNQTVTCKLSGKTWHEIPQYYTTTLSGRIYYRGSFALQGMSSVVREAALGSCFEVDLRTSVFSFYKMLLDGHSVDTSVLTELMFDKAQFRKTLAKTLVNTNTSEEHKIAMVKEAITAMGFGAKSSLYGSIQKIIWNSEDRAEMFKHPLWLGLKSIKTEVTKIVNKQYAKEISAYKKYCVGVDKKYSIGSFLAYLYQDYETRQMMTVMSNLDRYKLLLWVHDGVYVRKRPDTSVVLHDIQQINPWAQIDCKQINKYTYLNDAVELEQLEHEMRMAEQERIAQIKYSGSSKHYSEDEDVALTQILKEQGYML
jgi:hypothetical protein